MVLEKVCTCVQLCWVLGGVFYPWVIFYELDLLAGCVDSLFGFDPLSFFAAGWP